MATSPGRHRVTEALWVTVLREGVAGISVRSVAAEAGVSGGTVQYYFPTRSRMLQYVMELTADRVERRILAMPRSGPPQEWTRAILLELLPLNVERREEFSVWLAFAAHAHTDPALDALKRATVARQRDLYRHLVLARRVDADSEATIPCDSDSRSEIQAALLHAVIDGLALQLADLSIDEAISQGPILLDKYLTSDRA